MAATATAVTLIKSTPYSAVYKLENGGLGGTALIDYTSAPELAKLVAGPYRYEIVRWLNQLDKYNLGNVSHRDCRIRIYRVGGLSTFAEIEPVLAYSITWVAAGLQVFLDAGAEADLAYLLIEIRFIHSSRR